MRIPHVTDRVIGAPTQALRTVLRGVGRLVVAADGFRRPRPDGNGGDGAGPGLPENPAHWRPLDRTGNVRLLSPDELTPDELDEEPGPWAAATDDVAAGGEALPADEAAALPVPGYDGLSLASLRARLRGLDAAQVRMLAGYERAHAARPDVLGMFERRIVKLESGS
jgi:hypothetical protein